MSKSKKYKKKYYTSVYGKECPWFKDEEDIKSFADVIIYFAKEGKTLEMILALHDIPNSLWVINYKKHKLLREAVSDAGQFHKAYGQEQLQDMATGDIKHSPIMAKIWLSSFYDINEVYNEPAIQASKSDKYQVLTKMHVPEVEESESEEESTGSRGNDE